MEAAAVVTRIGKDSCFLRVQLVYDKVTLVNVAENVNLCVNLE